MHGFPVGFDYPANATILGQSGVRKNPIKNTISYAIIKACIIGELNEDASHSFLRFERKDWGKPISFLPLSLPLTLLGRYCCVRRNSPLVLDAAGKCILRIYSDEDMIKRNKHMTVGRTGSSKGKHSSDSVSKPGAPPKKKRRVVDSDENADDDDDEPLVSKRRSAKHHDQSIEGWLAFYYPYSINSMLRYSR